MTCIRADHDTAGDGTTVPAQRLIAMQRPQPLAVLALFALVAVGCTAPSGPSASPGAPATPGATATPAPSPSPVGNADVAVIRIEQTPGMLPPWESMRWYPYVALYGDGRLIMQGPQVDMYPGPALPNLQVTHFSQHAVEQALVWAAEAGLRGEDRQLGPMILDAGELLFSVTTPAGTHRTSVTDISVDDPAINALREFQDVMTSLATWLPEDVASESAPFQFDRLRVISFPADPQSLPDPAFATTVDWPLDSDLATLGVSWSEPAQYRCFELAGDDLATALPVFAAANELTLYESADVTYQLYLHPLLPDDEACPGF
jgi:hypothetical protein